jgi:tetratricopeptide (TPR) repeat protein
VLARELGDHAAALEAYEVVAAAEPARRDLAQASVASALACGRWDAAMGRFVAFSAAIGRMDRELLDAIEGAATAGGAYGPATAALEAAIAAANVFGPLARDLEKTVARWHLETRADAASAEAALVRALDHDPDDLDGWRRLVELRRAVPSRALHDALWRVAALAQNDVDALHEAAELAMGRDGQAGLGDDALIDESLHRLWDRASRLARREASTEGTRLPIASAAWALENLVARRLAAGAHREAFALLLEGAALPLPPERRRALRVQAADLASGPLADPARAIDLYRAVLDEAPADAYVADRLAVLFERGERFSDLLALRKQELERTTDVDRRLALRLDVARLVGELERRGGRVEALRANLDEHPGHAPTIDVLSAYFRERRAFGELADLLAAQAQRVENIDPARAAALYAELAALAEGELGDVPRAIAAHRKVVSLAPTVASLDALARLYTERGEPKHAVEWLERRLAQTVGAERTAVALDLARALLSSGQKEGAIQRLEAALAEDPASAEIREILASLYREQEAWAPLGKLLADSAAFITDEALLLERVRDAAEVFVTRLRRPDLAVAVLETGVRLAPDDRAMKTMLAEAYRTSGRLDEARGILESLVADFGRRRSAERATLHQNLARVYDALGDVEQALAQLDLASSMDANNTGVFLDLGRLARQAGQLDRAERAYRALLMLVRRQTDESVDAVGIPEVQFELSRLAAARHEHGQARELLESAIAGATQNDLETLRFVRALRDREEFELSRRVLEERLAAVTEPSDRAPLLVALGDVLADGLGRPSEALEAWLDALACRPTDDALILKARGAARASGRTSDFVDAMRDKASKLRRQEDAVAAAHVLLAVGRALEEDAADLSGARDVYRRVEQSGHRVAEARTALARVAAGLGDAKEEARVLELLVEEEHGDATTDGLYRLAALRVAASGDSALDAALDTLDRALARQPRWDVAGAVLRAAAERAPGDERVLSAYERVARQAGDRGLLLDYLERRAALPTGSLDEVREGAAVAVELGLRDRAEALLQRGVEIARDGAEGLASAIWTLTDLAAHRRAAGDVAGAMRWLQIALDAAYPEDAPALAFELATLACAPGGDLEVAALALERLRERDPADRRVWEPLLDVYQRIGDLERLGAHVAATLEALLDPVDRNAVRLSQARFLLERGADKEAIGLLRDALGEDPEHAEAAALLADVLQRLGSSTELVELVQRQLDGAKDKGEPAAVAELSLKLVGLYDIEGRRDDALDVVRSALDFAPDDRRLLETLVRLVGTDAHPRDRAEAMERLLAVEEGDAASRVATELAEIYTALEDDEAVERVLVLGHRRAPADDALRTRLGDLLRARGDHEKLAAMLELDGMRTADATRAVVWLREAAALYRDALGRPTDAARALRAALAHARDDADLLADLIGALAAAGDLETAIAEVSAALGRVGDGTERARLLCERGKLRLRAGDDAAGIADLEEAFALAGPSAVFDLADGLDLARQRADAEAARAMTFRLVDVLGAGVDPARARDVLAEWVSTAGDDVEALRVLARVDAAAERWGDVVDTCARLLHLEEGDAQVKTALLLADAAARVDRPDEARAALEHVFSAQPGDERIRDRLRALYTELGADRELAAILMADAEASVDGDVRFASFRRAGELLMRAGDVPAALSALGAAREIRKDDHDLTVALVDAYIASGMYPEAGALLEEAIAAQGKRRTPELAQLQHRMGRLAGAAGARDTELEWYKVAMESDKNNGDIAADLAELAMHLGDSETALKALRAITLMKQTGRMSRAVAFLRQAQIAAQKGDTRRAILWGRKAKEEDPDLAEADAFLREVGDA